MRKLMMTAATFGLTIGLFAGLGGYGAPPKAVNTARVTHAGGPVLVRMPDGESLDPAQLTGPAAVREADDYERGWIAPEVVPAAREVGLFQRLRSDLN